MEQGNYISADMVQILVDIKIAQSI